MKTLRYAVICLALCALSLLPFGFAEQRVSSAQAPSLNAPFEPAWPTYGHDSRRTFFTPDEVRPPLKLKWRAKVALQRPGSLVVGFGRVYVPDRGEILAFKAVTGELLWRQSINNAASGPYARPADLTLTQDGRLLTLEYQPDTEEQRDSSKNLVALDAHTGEIIWRCEGVRNRCSVVGKTIFIADFEGNILLVQTGDGAIIGRLTPEDKPEGVDAVRAVVGDEGRLASGIITWREHMASFASAGGPPRILWERVLGDWHHINAQLANAGFFAHPACLAPQALYCVKAGTGTATGKYEAVCSFNYNGKVWMKGGQTFGLPLGDVGAPTRFYGQLAIAHNLIYGGVSSWNEREGRTTDMMFALNSTNGSIKWRTRGLGGRGPLLASGGILYLSGCGHLFALDAHTGKVLWRSPESGYRNIVVAGDSIYALTYEDGKYFLSALEHDKDMSLPTGVAWMNPSLGYKVLVNSNVVLRLRNPYDRDTDRGLYKQTSQDNRQRALAIADRLQEVFNAGARAEDFRIMHRKGDVIQIEALRHHILTVNQDDARLNLSTRDGLAKVWLDNIKWSMD